ncbi:DUF3108 domain-containing protein [Anaeromyxobacter paludicola]|uniref:DUF3108 domain-containing protein n=1 Tax=Anaeromyxobacter paludicola TaxID=2918171 RepID=A0ABN6N1L9_9BACT|nr:DUF3108 domain-containing protein [Anaeromyxobacter paludicola]BDG07115.1 hypothetical protein AMPC_02280 [Anaeromyxobacter paludicola]
MTALLAALLLSAPPACGLPPLRPGALPFREGERLSFDLDVMGVVKAGTLRATVEPATSGGAVIPVRARLQNTSVFAKVRRVKGQAMSWFDARTLRPDRYRDDVDEDGVRKSTEVRLAGQPAQPSLSWQFGDKKGVTRFERQAEALDLVTLVYYLRAADPRPGTTYCFDLVANRRYWHVKATLAPGTEKVDTEAGSFQTVRLDAVAERADKIGARRPFHLWYSTDARRLPVAAVSEIDLGPVRAMLHAVATPLQAGE